MTSRRLAVLALALAGLLAPLLVDGPAAAGPTVVTTRQVIGTSVLGRPIVAVHRTRSVTPSTDPAALAAATRTLLVVGSIHGNEKAGLRVVRRLRERDSLPGGLDLWLIPTINPDGTAADRRTNAHAVDLNRNFPFHWRSGPRSPTWSGPAPMSEPESIVLRDFVRRVRPDLTVVFHQPLFGVGATDKGMPTVRALARGMRLPVNDFRCGGVCYGTFTGWLNHALPGLGITIEFARTAPTWRINLAAWTLVEVGRPTIAPTPTDTLTPTATESPAVTPTA